MKFDILRTNSEHPEFLPLVHQLNQYLAGVNGESNDFFASFNSIEQLNQVILVFENNRVIGCGAFKPYNEDSVEIKRMFVEPTFRGKGVASLIVTELENWAVEIGFHQSILETSKEMKDAVGLYQKLGYQKIPNYPPYENVETSICFEKTII